MSIWNRVLFLSILFLLLFGLQFLAYKTFRRFVKQSFPSSKFLNYLSIYPFIIFNLPYLYLFAKGFSSADLPQWLYNFVFMPFYIYQTAMLFIGLYLFTGKVIKAPFALAYIVLKKFKTTRSVLERFSNKKTVKKINYSRRMFIKSSAAIVSGYAFIGSTLGVLNSDDYEIIRKEILIPGLPVELKRQTITLVCDIHSGPFMNENLMREYVEVINDLKSDFIFIPGDITNSNKNEVHPFANAFKDLKASKGVYGTLGNHDYFSDPEYIANVVMNETPINLLRNDSKVINVNNKEICIIGIEDTRQSGANPDPVLMNYFQSTMDNTRKKLSESNLDYNAVPKILLFHKPYFFDSISKESPELVLSGHTHGGQVVLAKLGNINISFAGAISKYISGIYKSGKSTMYVSRGIGSVLLPVRVNCAPEITQITLV